MCVSNAFTSFCFQNLVLALLKCHSIHQFIRIVIRIGAKFLLDSSNRIKSKKKKKMSIEIVILPHWTAYGYLDVSSPFILLCFSTFSLPFSSIFNSPVISLRYKTPFFDYLFKHLRILFYFFWYRDVYSFQQYPFAYTIIFRSIIRKAAYWRRQLEKYHNANGKERENLRIFTTEAAAVWMRLLWERIDGLSYFPRIQCKNK